MAGIEELNKTIERFEKAQQDLREESRKAHEVIQAVKEQRKALEREVQDIFDAFDKKIEEYVKKELAEIGEQADKAADQIYDKVGRQIDILIELSLGKHLSRRNKVEDIRPALAEKLGEWIREELDKRT